jgi:hypothetical protein
VWQNLALRLSGPAALAQPNPVAAVLHVGGQVMGGEEEEEEEDSRGGIGNWY